MPKYKIHEFEQGSPEWLAYKIGYISATAANDLLTTGKRRELLYKIISERVYGRKEYLDVSYAKDSEGNILENHHMKRGIEKEQDAINKYIEVTGATDTRQIGFAELEGYDRVGCSPDLIVGSEGLAEFKCPGIKNACKYMIDGWSRQYGYQMQFQMWAMDKKWNDFVVFDDRNPVCEISIKRYKRNEETCNKIEMAVKALEMDVRAGIKRLEALGMMDYGRS